MEKIGQTLGKIPMELHMFKGTMHRASYIMRDALCKLGYRLIRDRKIEQRLYHDLGGVAHD